MEVIVTLNSYLNKLKEIEVAKPVEQQKPVPSLTDLAEVSGLNPSAVSKYANNRVTGLNRKVLGAIIHELRLRGFPCDVGDILRYVE